MDFCSSHETNRRMIKNVFFFLSSHKNVIFSFLPFNIFRKVRVNDDFRINRVSKKGRPHRVRQRAAALQKAFCESRATTFSLCLLRFDIFLSLVTRSLQQVDLNRSRLNQRGEKRLSIKIRSSVRTDQDRLIRSDTASGDAPNAATAKIAKSGGLILSRHRSPDSLRE